MNRKVALITGGASGLGRAAGEVFVKHGLDVAIVDIDREAGEAFARELGEEHAAFFHCNVARISSIEETVQAVATRFSRIDILLNCAAISIRRRIPEITEKEWDSFMNIDLKAPLFLAKAVAPHMRKAGGGKIVNFSSILSANAHGRHTLYGGAKEGLNAITRSLALELAPDNISVVSILPTYVITPMIEFRLQDPVWMAKQLEQSLNKEVLYPRHVVQVLLFLATCSTRAFNAAKVNLDSGFLQFKVKEVDWTVGEAEL